MTPEELAQTKLLTAEEHSAMWAMFYGHASDGCFVDPGHETAMLELVKAQPLYLTIPLEPATDQVTEPGTEHMGIFAWKRHNETIGFVAISVGEDQECCMMDVSPEDIIFYQKRAA